MNEANNIVDTLLKEVYELYRNKEHLLRIGDFFESNNIELSQRKVIKDIVMNEDLLNIIPYQEQAEMTPRGIRISEAGGWLKHLDKMEQEKKV